MPGRIIHIYVAAVERGEALAVERAELLAGAGIAGDRYCRAGDARPGRNLTFIEVEEIERFNAAHGLVASAQGTRRNIVTRGIRLNELVGREFLVGGVRARGVELCEPCRTLGRNLSTPTLDAAEVVRAFVHRAGLRADILSSGPIAVGDAIVAIDSGLQAV